MSEKTTKIKIEFASWIGEAALEIEASTIKEAVESAVKDGANLYGADLSYSNLEGVNLYGTNLEGANLYGANLYGADLSYSNLYGANLYGANLYGANLYGANLYGANLYGTNLEGANLADAKHNGKKLWKTRPVMQFGCCGSIERTTLVMFYADKSEPMIYCGCFRGTIDEFESKIHKTHAGTFHEYEYMAMIEHIKAIRKYQLEVKDGK